MTDPKTPVEPRGPLSDDEREYYRHVAAFNAITQGDRLTVQPCRDVLALDSALRAALKDRDEARGETVRWRDKAYIALTARVKDDEAVKAERDTLRAKLEIAREALVHYGKIADTDGALGRDRRQVAREALAKLEEKF